MPKQETNQAWRITVVRTNADKPDIQMHQQLQKLYDDFQQAAQVACRAVALKQDIAEIRITRVEVEQ